MKWMKSPTKDQKINKREGKESGQERALVASLLWFPFLRQEDQRPQPSACPRSPGSTHSSSLPSAPFQQRVTNQTFHNFFPIAFPISRTLIPSYHFNCVCGDDKREGEWAEAADPWTVLTKAGCSPGGGRGLHRGTAGEPPSLLPPIATA